MIVQCPNCQSKSRVDDAGAARGARVRCASCAHVFLPNTAIVSPKPAAAVGPPASGSAEEEFGGKTSLFTGVVSRDLVGLTGAGAPPKAMSDEATQATAPRPKPSPAAPDSDEGFGGGSNRTQAIDVSQLAAFSAKMPSTPDPKTAPQAGLGAAASKAAAARPKPSLAPISAAPVKLSTVLDQETVAEDLGTAVVGTHEPGLLSAGATTTSRVLGGMSVALGVCGLIFFSAGNAVYAQAGLMGGSAIDIAEAHSPGVEVEQVTSALYSLADGHEALVALGTVGNPTDAQGPRMEVQFSLSDANGTVFGQARGPVGAVLTLEELATITLPDSAAAELRRRVQSLPLVAPHSHDRKFMAVIKDPKHPLSHMVQSLTLVQALPAEPAPAVQPAAANAAPEPPTDPIMDPELPQTAIPPPPQAVSAMPATEDGKAGIDSDNAPAPKARKKVPGKAKKRRGY